MIALRNITCFVLILFWTVNCARQNFRAYYEEDIEVNLYAVIGKKVSLNEFNPDERYKKMRVDSLTGDTVYFEGYIMDYCFDAKYKVEDKVFNDLKADTVEFLVFNHYGRPLFEESEYVLLYLSKLENDEGLFLQKYQYDLVRENKEGNWTGLDGESIKALFLRKKNGVLENRGVF